MASLRWASLLLLYFGIVLSLASSSTELSDARDVQVLKAVKSKWQNIPPKWKGSDPCNTRWDGLLCNDSRITSLALSSMNLSGTLATEIGFLSSLQSLDLAYNKGLTGPIPNTLGKLINLTSLVLIGCGFTGHIPHELGNLQELTFLDLSSNNFTGTIPSSLGNLTKLYLLDLANNQLSGSLPVSSLNGCGLDRLIKAKHFHLNKNRLSGFIPPHIFHSDMQLIHVLFDSNSFVGEIPSTLGNVPTLEIIRLDGNSLEGPIPSDIGKLKNVNEMHLSNNNLGGAIPDLSGMERLQYIDLSNNSFEASEALQWICSLEQLTTLVIENGKLTGAVPSKLFSLPQLETVRLRNNDLNGTLKIGTEVSTNLQLVDLENNHITVLDYRGNAYANTLRMSGNPACDKNSDLAHGNSCIAETTEFSYATPLESCGGKICSEGFRVNPATCECASPYEGELIFRSPSFSDLSNISRLDRLRNSLCSQLNFSQEAVSISSVFFDSHYYLTVKVQLFPLSKRPYFDRSEILKIGFAFSNKIYTPPDDFGTYYFVAISYYFIDPTEPKGLSTGARFGIACGAGVSAFIIAGVGVYAFFQKRRADRAIRLSKPFAYWKGTGSDSECPKVNDVKCFSYRELNKCTNYFSEAYKIGSGGYGTVYKGVLSDNGEMVAIKRAKRGSLQGRTEFKNEIELLSRVHHKNLVRLLGFCFDKEEQMLVYEYMPVGSLADKLSGKCSKRLDWRKRISIALGAARGLAYLHEHVNPPIIHRDVKSSNILLDEDLNAKVSDFGLSKLAVYGKEKNYLSTKVKGTMGYMDPEYYNTLHLSEKSDVYSFGVVLLEILTGRQALEEGQYVVQMVKSSFHEKGEVRGILDPFLRADTCCDLSAYEKFLNLALPCLEDSGANRPSISHVVKELECLLNMVEGKATQHESGFTES